MRRIFLVSLFSIAAVAIATSAQGQNWYPVGPPGGSVRALAADPRDPHRIFLGTADGLLFRSDDGGANWRQMRPGFAQRGMSLDQIAVDARGTVLVGYWRVQGAGGGVARSEDGGQTFTTLPGITGESVRALALAPSDHDVIAAGSLGGVFLSRDAGRSWHRISPEGHADLRNVESLAFDPADPNVLYAGTWHLGWKTLDGGTTWTPVHQGMIDDSDVMTITVDRRDSRIVYATACTGVYRSADAAARWAKLPGIPEPSRRTRAFAQDRGDPNLLFAGTTKGLWMSENGGQRWRLATPDQPIVNAVLVQPDGTILLGTEGRGVLRSADRGRTWATSNTGFSDKFVARLLFDPERHWLFAAVSDDSGVFVAGSGGGRWARLSAGLEHRHVLSLARIGGTVYVGTDDGIYARIPGTSARWTRLPTAVNGEPVHPRVTELIAFPPARLLAATTRGLLASADGGATWSQPALGSDGAVFALAALHDDPRTIVAATRGGVLRSGDGGETWTRVSTGLAGVTPHALATLPGRHPALLATTTGGLFRSEDRGTTWKRVGGGLPHCDLSGLAVHPDGRTVYVSNFNFGGIFRSADGGTTWQRMPTGDLPSDRVWNVSLDPGEPDRMFASSPSGLYVLAPASVALGDADVP